MNYLATLTATITIGLLSAPAATAQVVAEDPNVQTIEVASGKLSFEAPKGWQVVPPKSRILEKELSVPCPPNVKAIAGRLTIMAAGGSVKANLDRWVGQFQAIEGDADKKEIEVNGMSANLLDVSGTYLESSGGPFGPKTPRSDYRMLGAIVETGSAGNYFFKLVGPQETLDSQADAFQAMVESLKKN